MTNEQLLILFFINTDSSLKGIYALTNLLTRNDFKISPSLKFLIDKDFVFVTKTFDNGTWSTFDTTQNGKEYLKMNFDIKTTLEFIDSHGGSEFLKELLNKYYEKFHDSNYL